MKLPLYRGLLAAALALCAAAPARAVDVAWSGFATLGYARSDSAYTYQGSIDDGGTLRRDTRLAGQLDLRLSPQWSATVQAQLAPADDSDNRWHAKTAWAFVAWRPDNDWLLRVGKARLPMYLYSESLDVGVASDMARLPHEMYSIAPTNDFTGLFITRSFTLGEHDLSVDAYSGRAAPKLRQWLRDGVPPVQPAGARYTEVDVRVSGLTLTARDTHLTWRLGVHTAHTARSDGQTLPVRYPRVDIGPGLGYWQVNAALPGPGIEQVDRIHNLALTAGLEWQLGDGWRIASEFVRVQQRDIELGSDSRAGYLALFKRIGAWTPYLSVAFQRSSDGVLGWRRRLIDEGLPAQMPGATQINAAQRVAGEAVYAFDQRALALGVSYALSPTAKLKAEWLRTRVGAASAHFDTPPGLPDPRDLRVDTLSFNVNVAF